MSTAHFGFPWQTPGAEGANTNQHENKMMNKFFRFIFPLSLIYRFCFGSNPAMALI